MAADRHQDGTSPCAHRTPFRRPSATKEEPTSVRLLLVYRDLVPVNTPWRKFVANFSPGQKPPPRQMAEHNAKHDRTPLRRHHAYGQDDHSAQEATSERATSKHPRQSIHVEASTSKHPRRSIHVEAPTSKRLRPNAYIPTSAPTRATAPSKV